MIVEDDQAVASHLANGIQALGWRPCLARSSAEALALLRDAADVTVMVADIRMPNGSGLELAEAVMRTRPDEMATEVILITGQATANDVAIALRAGACDFLCKPFRLYEVETAVAKAEQRALGRREAQRGRRQEHLATVNLARELASLRQQVLGMQDALCSGSHWTEAEREKATRAIPHALRTALQDIASGVDLIDAGAPRAENVELLRAGVQSAVRAIEVLEAFNHPSARRNPPWASTTSLPSGSASAKPSP